jgi:Concanavalin A-like lectin/glucanases superfamily
MSLIQVTKPALQFPFNGSNVDSVTNLSPTTTTGTPTYVNGIYGQAVSFTNPTSGNPTSNIYYATIPSFSSTSGFTFSFWFKFTPVSFYTAVPVSLAGYFFYYINGYDSKIYPNPTANGGPATPATVLNTWYNIAGVFTNGLLTTYLNGVQSNTHVLTGPVTVGGPTNGMQVASSSASYGFNGLIQDLRIYNTALTDIQVQSLYANGGAPGVPPSTTIKTQPFPPNYNYLADITDYSSNPINLATYAASSVVQNANSPFPAEYSFDITTFSGAPKPPSGLGGRCAYYFLSVSKLNFDFFSTTSNSFLECWLYVPIGSTLGTYPAIASRFPAASKSTDVDWQFGVSPVSGSNIPIGMFFLDQFGNRIGPSGLGSINATVGQWNHVTMGWSSLNSRVYIGVNGNIISGTRDLNANASQYLATANTVIGSQYWDSGCLLSNFRLVSLGVNILPYTTSTYTIPTSPLDIYPTGTTALLIRSHQIMTMTGTPLLSQLSVAPVAAFSLRAVGGTTARAVQVVRSSDSAVQDFYADRLGNLLTAPVTGTDLATWLGGSTGSVATWYDQSGNGNHAIQGTQANRPVINVATSPYSLIFSGNGSISGQSLQTSSLSFTPGAAGGKIGVEYIVGNNTGGCVLGAGSSARKWWLASTSTASTPNELTQGNFPATVGGGEGYSMCSTAITSAKTTVVYNSTASGSGQLYYINRTSQTTTSKSWNTNRDGTFPLVIGAMTGGDFTYYSGNLYELIVTIPNFSTSDISLF